MTQPSEWEHKKKELQLMLKSLRAILRPMSELDIADWGRAETLKEVTELIEAAEGIRDDSYEILNDGHPSDCDLCKRHGRFVEALARLKEKV